MINLLKRLPILNKIRIRKRLNYYVYRYMLSEKQVILGENNPNCKHDLVTKQLKKYPTKSLELRNKIDHIYANANITTNQNELFIDICFCFFAYGYSPNEYVCYDFKNKSTEERRAFISDRESVCYGYRMNDIESMHVFMNKMRTYEKYCEYYKRDAISISKIQDKEKFLDFINRHNIFIKKEVNESCGRSIELINMNNSNLGAEELFSTFLSKGEIILEERVVQDTIMNQLNSSSVNTVRCITMKTKNGVITPFCFLKIGRAGALIDNGMAGGILVGIDSDTGKLVTDGVDEMNNRYAFHPDSGVRFVGFQLPEWKQLLSICIEMSAKTPAVKLIGWDMAHTEIGWVVIEGNGLTEVIGPQSTFLRGIRSEWEFYMSSMDLIF